MDTVQYENLQKENELLAKRNATQCAQGMAGKAYGGLDLCSKVPLVEQFQKQREHLLSQLERVERLLGMLQAHPEFEAYQDFQDLQDLLRRDW